VEKKIGEVETHRVELPDVAVDGEGDPVERAVGEAAGAAEVGREGDGSKQEAVGEGVPVCQGRIVEYLIEVVVEEGRAEGIPVEGKDPETADDEKGEALVVDAPLKGRGFRRWILAECRGTASGHCSILLSQLHRRAGSLVAKFTSRSCDSRYLS
jgi:hypothetical protein